MDDTTWDWVPFRKQVIGAWDSMTEEDWNGVPIVGDVRRVVIDGIPDQFWNDLPVVGPVRQALLTMEEATRIPAWLWAIGAAFLVLLLVLLVVRR